MRSGLYDPAGRLADRSLCRLYSIVHMRGVAERAERAPVSAPLSPLAIDREREDYVEN
jgi:hypothetical protein